MEFQRDRNTTINAAKPTSDARSNDATTGYGSDYENRI